VATADIAISVVEETLSVLTWISVGPPADETTGVWLSGLPQWPQNTIPYGFSPPQFGHPRGLPQTPQNFIPCGLSLLQDVHLIDFPGDDSLDIRINGF